MKRYIFSAILVIGILSTFSLYAEEDDTPVKLDEIAGEKNLTSSRPWRAPDFSQQAASMGWTENAFDVPKGLEAQVKFWIDIYAKYNSDQGVLHDSENIDFIYAEIDFTSITARTDINEFQKERLKKKLVKSEKQRVTEILKRLEEVKDVETLNPEEKKIWNYFSQIDEKKKFLAATKKNRLRFQLGQKDRMIQGIYFSGRYLEDFEKIFREAGLPMELTRLVFVESSFNVLARSKVGASGLWQLMTYTARPYMRLTPAVDKRNHPIEATKVAAKILRLNYSMLESWPLAVTGWNHGPTGILKLTRKYSTRELGELVDSGDVKKKFGFASKNFYASFLAALEVEKNASKYLGAVSWSQPLDSVELTSPVELTYKELLVWFGGDDMKAQIFNPHLTKPVRQSKLKIAKGTVLSVPKANYDQVFAELNNPERKFMESKKSKKPH